MISIAQYFSFFPGNVLWFWFDFLRKIFSYVSYACTSYDYSNFWNRRTKLEPVRLSITTRTGNKKATLVDNLDYYGISPADVVHQIQRIAAASATGTYMYLLLYWSTTAGSEWYVAEASRHIMPDIGVIEVEHCMYVMRQPMYVSCTSTCSLWWMPCPQAIHSHIFNVGHRIANASVVAYYLARELFLALNWIWKVVGMAAAVRGHPLPLNPPPPPHYGSTTYFACSFMGCSKKISSWPAIISSDCNIIMEN